MLSLFTKKPAESLAVIAVTLILTGCFFESATDVHHFYGRALGTSYNIRFVGLSSDAQSLQNGVEAVLDDINQSMSTYVEDSELNRLNNVPDNSWVSVSEPLVSVIALAQAISAKSDGAFDVTVGPLVDLWGFGPEARLEKVPEPQVLQAVFADIGYQGLEVDPKQSRVRKLLPRQIDLSAIAKGYAVDAIAEYLDSEQISAYLVEVGGEMRLKGFKPDNQLWRIAIETPESGARGVYKILPLTDIALATSGDYRNYFEVEGVRYSHTLNPGTGYPITHSLASVTVLSKTAAEADGWATALNVLGTQPALSLAERENLAVFLIEKGQEGFIEYSSSAFNELTNGGL